VTLEGVLKLVVWMCKFRHSEHYKLPNNTIRIWPHYGPLSQEPITWCSCPYVSVFVRSLLNNRKRV